MAVLNRKATVVEGKNCEILLKAKKETYNVALSLVSKLEKDFGVKTYAGERISNNSNGLE